MSNLPIASQRVVTLNYTLLDDDGEILESTEGADPLVYLRGSNSLIPGLEEALTGKKSGDSFRVKVAADDAYGERDETLIETLPRGEFNDVDPIEVGMQFEAQTDEGPLIVTVIDVNDEEITVDGNHELAGLDLTFEVQVLEVRDATAEELEHGHAHGGDGCDHDHDFDDEDDDEDEDDEDVSRLN